MNWHDDANTRKSIGDGAEQLFAQQVRCACGGSFDFIGDNYPGCPDFTCENCGRLVDIKSSPQAERTGNIAVSEKPWQGYPDDLVIVTRIGGCWLGEYKRFIRVENQRPFEPTHNGRHSQLKNTRWHLICWRTFRPIAALGMVTP